MMKGDRGILTGIKKKKDNDGRFLCGKTELVTQHCIVYVQKERNGVVWGVSKDDVSDAVRLLEK